MATMAHASFFTIHSLRAAAATAVSIILCEMLGAVPASGAPPVPDSSSAPATAATTAPSTNSLLSMSLEDLMSVPVRAVSLTDTDRKKAPATVTTITQEMIRSSGARNLFELLDIYIPGFQWERHYWEPSHMGLRGIIGDREDKYLLLVNGHDMNEHTHFGALSEKDLVMLDDIHRIEVVRGPGSAILGPGAVSMVINIITLNAQTFQGTEATVKGGAIENFTSLEMKHTEKLTDSLGLFLYGGISDYDGANQQFSPEVQGRTTPTIHNEYQVDSGEGVPYSVNNDREQYRGLPPMKLHAELSSESFDWWARFTRGGTQGAIAPGFVLRAPVGWTTADSAYVNDFGQPGFGYQQFATQLTFKNKINEHWSLEHTLSYNLTDYERQDPTEPDRLTNVFAHREDRYQANELVHWKPTDAHSLAIGVEYTHEEFGLRSEGMPWEPAKTPESLWPAEMPRWDTDTYSFFGEYQWNINDKWTTFVSARTDKNTYSDWLFSPRFALIYTPTHEDVVKLLLYRSLRRNFDEELKKEYEDGQHGNDTETANSVELRYEKQLTEPLWLGASLYYEDLDLIGYMQNTARSEEVGKTNIVGFELEATYQTKRTTVRLSHSFTKMLHFYADDISSGELVSAAPYGFGNDLANWSNNISKVWASYDLSDRWSADSSLIAYWGFQGSKDFVNYLNSSRTADAAWTDPGYNDSFGPSIYFNVGLTHRVSKDLSIRLDGYNLLGIFNQQLNKREYIVDSYAYRSMAPSVAVSLRWKF